MEEEKGINYKGILTVMAAVLMNLIGGILYNFASISQYVASYLYYNGNPDVTIKDMFFLMPIGAFFQNALAGVGGYMEGRFGVRISCSIGISLIVTGFVLFYSFANLYIFYLGSGIVGFGIGLCYLAPLRVSWKHFSNKKGLVSGLIMTGFGFSATIFNFLSDLIMNPENKRLLPNNYYEEEVANKFPEYIKIVIFIFISMGVVIVSCLFQPPKEAIQDGNMLKKKIEHLIDSDLELDLSLHEISEEDLDQIAQLLSHPEKEQEPYIIAFCSSQFILMCIMVFCFVFYPFMLINVVRPFGNLSIDPTFMRFLMLCFPIANGSSRLFWGIMLDYVPFKILYLTLIILGIIVSSTIGFITDYPWVYFTYCMISANLCGGNFGLMPTFTTKIFGLKNSTELYGIVCLFCGLSNLSGPFIAKFMIRETVKDDYLLVFWIGTFLLSIAFIVCCTLKEEKFFYTREIKYKKQIDDMDDKQNTLCNTTDMNINSSIDKSSKIDECDYVCDDICDVENPQI